MAELGGAYVYKRQLGKSGPEQDGGSQGTQLAAICETRVVSIVQPRVRVVKTSEIRHRASRPLLF